MTILVFGQSGQLARALTQALGAEARPVGREQADLSNPGSIYPFLAQARPRAILNAAAYTQVDQAEQERALAFAVNAHAPAEMARYAAEAAIPLIHYSSDYVYDGSGDAPRREDAPIAPLNAYGESKAAGDAAIMDACPHAVILRTSWVFDATGKNFLTTMLRLMREREELRVVADQRGAPSYAPHLAEATRRVLSLLPAAQAGKDGAGVYHLCNAGATSWHGFAEAILAEATRHDPSIRCRRILPIATADYPTPAARPLNSRLDCARIRATFGIALPDWRQGLTEAIEAIYGRA